MEHIPASDDSPLPTPTLFVPAETYHHPPTAPPILLYLATPPPRARQENHAPNIIISTPVYPYRPRLDPFNGRHPLSPPSTLFQFPLRTLVFIQRSGFSTHPIGMYYTTYAHAPLRFFPDSGSDSRTPAPSTPLDDFYLRTLLSRIDVAVNALLLRVLI